MFRNQPRFIVKNAQGKTYAPETARVRVEVLVNDKLRFRVNLELSNRKSDIIDEALDYLPERFRGSIRTAYLQPARVRLVGGVLGRIQFDCTGINEDFLLAPSKK